MGLAHLGLTNTKDYRAFAQKLYERFKNLKCIVVTLGAQGSYALDISKSIVSRCEANKVTLASTVGANMKEQKTKETKIPSKSRDFRLFCYWSKSRVSK